MFTLDAATTDGEPTTGAACGENQDSDAAPDTAETDTRIEAEDDSHELRNGESDDASGAAVDGGADEGPIGDSGADDTVNAA